jgi:hypothetical protein
VGNFREAFDLLIELLQFQVEQLAPYDPLLHGFAEIRMAAGSTLFVETFQTRYGFGQPSVKQGPSRILHPPPLQDLQFAMHSDARGCISRASL